MVEEGRGSSGDGGLGSSGVPSQVASGARAEGGALLPCPFCGSGNVDPEGWMSATADGQDGLGETRTGPACDDCGGSADSVELWNKRPREGGIARCLGFFASVIKSGEPWTATCQAEYEKALGTSTASPAEQ